MPKFPEYDKATEFQSEVLPLLKALADACSKHEMPLAVVLCYARDDEQSKIAIMSGGKRATSPDTLWTLINLLQNGEDFETAMKLIHETFANAQMEARLN